MKRDLRKCLAAGAGWALIALGMSALLVNAVHAEEPGPTAVGSSAGSASRQKPIGDSPSALARAGRCPWGGSKSGLGVGSPQAILRVPLEPGLEAVPALERPRNERKRLL